MTVLALDQVTIEIAEKVLFSKLNININAGECWAILGRNGVGKTTLLHSMAGIKEASQGSIHLLNKSISDYSRKDVAQNIAVLLQQQEQSFPARVKDLVEMGRHPHRSTWQTPSEKDAQAIDQAITELELQSLKDRDIQTLSGGEQRRVEIATVFAQTPKLYLLDEPINHLDIAHQVNILERIKEKSDNENTAVVMVLHDINVAAQFCDHCLMLMGNNTYLAGKTDDLLTSDNLEKLYQQKFIQSNIQGKAFFSPIYS